MKNGVIISFEGPDGAGKTSVLERIIPLLQAQGLGDTRARWCGDCRADSRGDFRRPSR